jgi:hypothetical protein
MKIFIKNVIMFSMIGSIIVPYDLHTTNHEKIKKFKEKKLKNRNEILVFEDYERNFKYNNAFKIDTTTKIGIKINNITDNNFNSNLDYQDYINILDTNTAINNSKNKLED